MTIWLVDELPTLTSHMCRDFLFIDTFCNSIHASAKWTPLYLCHRCYLLLAPHLDFAHHHHHVTANKLWQLKTSNTVISEIKTSILKTEPVTVCTYDVFFLLLCELFKSFDIPVNSICSCVVHISSSRMLQQQKTLPIPPLPSQNRTWVDILPTVGSSSVTITYY